MVCVCVKSGKTVKLVVYSEKENVGKLDWALHSLKEVDAHEYVYTYMCISIHTHMFVHHTDP